MKRARKNSPDAAPARVVTLFRDQKLALLVDARHREARLDALRRGVPEVPDPQSAPPDELAERRAMREAAAPT